MRNQHYRDRFRAPFLGLTALTIMVGHAKAAIDVGQTIVSVTTTETTTPIFWSPSDYSPYKYRYDTPATIISHAGVTDTQTGLQWIKATSLAEGQAQGYRAATSEEFSSFVTHMGWTSAPGSSNEFTLTDGFNYAASWSEQGIGYIGPRNSYQIKNQAPVSFSADASKVSPTFVNWVKDADHISLGWLDGVEGGAVGGTFTSVRTTFSYQSGKYGFSSTSYTDVITNEALLGTLTDLQAGLYDNTGTASATGGKWSTLANSLPQVDERVSLKYYMVADAVPGALPELVTTIVSAPAVPEPSSYALMGLGLLGVAVAIRRQRRT